MQLRETLQLCENYIKIRTSVHQEKHPLKNGKIRQRMGENIWHTHNQQRISMANKSIRTNLKIGKQAIYQKENLNGL